MPKLVYDLIQRFEIDGNNIPQLISTTFQVISGGDDLLSVAVNALKEYGIYKVSSEKRTSQYIGYRAKDSKSGGKRYFLILFPKKEYLSISIDESICSEHLLIAKQDFYTPKVDRYFWVPQTKLKEFKQIGEPYKSTLGSLIKDFPQPTGTLRLPTSKVSSDYLQYLNCLRKSDCCFNLEKSTLFPYTFQFDVNSRKQIEEFFKYFGKILAESL